MHADTQDLVIEQLSPQFPGKYKVPGGWDMMKESSEDIAIRFGRPYTLRSLSTKHGSVLLQNENTAVCLNWTGYDCKEPVLKTILAINKAKNWQDFNNALASYSGTPHTFIFADRRGNIGYHVAGNVPIKTSVGSTVTPGWNGAADWQGRVKFDDLAHGFNPPQGLVVADGPQFNNAGSYNNPLRAIRVADVLSGYKQSGQKIGLPEMALLQGDVAASFAPLVKKELEQSVARSQVIDDFQTSALGDMKKWDGNLTADSTAATIYESFIRTLTRRVLEPRLGSKMTQEYLEHWPRWSIFTQKLLKDQPKEWLPPEERTFDTFS